MSEKKKREERRAEYKFRKERMEEEKTSEEKNDLLPGLDSASVRLDKQIEEEI